jgi:heterotetrameric sarcosine oxidase gamma subunit
METNMKTPIRLSPLHGRHTELGAGFSDVAAWKVPQAYQSAAREAAAIRERVAVADLSFKGKVTVTGDGAGDLIARTFQLVHRPDGRSLAANNGMTSLPLTADEYLLLSPPGGEDEIVRCLADAGEPAVTVVDLTHGLAGFLLAGRDSSHLLRKICALPFDAVDFPSGHVAQTSLARVHATIVRHDRDGLPAFEIYVERPYGEYVWDVIFDAGAEFGIVPFGWQMEEEIIVAG